MHRLLSAFIPRAIAATCMFGTFPVLAAELQSSNTDSLGRTERHPEEWCAILKEPSFAFDSAYDSDLEMARLWHAARIAAATKPDRPGASSLGKMLGRGLPKSENEASMTAILRYSESFFREGRNDWSVVQERISESGLPATIRRAALDAALAFRMPDNASQFHVFGEIENCHADILSEAGPDERKALLSRLLRVVSQRDVVGGRVLENRLLFSEKCRIAAACFSGGLLEDSPVAWLRAASIVGEGRTFLRCVEKMQDSSFSDVGIFSIGDDGAPVPLPAAAKRKRIINWYLVSIQGLQNVIECRAHHSVSNLPMDAVYGFARDVGTAMGFSTKEEFVHLAERFDSEISTENGAMNDFWKRKMMRERGGAEAGPALPPDPGQLALYAASDKLRPDLDRYGLLTGTFIQAALEDPATTNRLAYLLYKPKGGGKVPLLLFVPGSGEMGFDLSRQFRQRTIFEKVTSAEFQKKHPCFLLVISPPEDCPDLCGYGLDMKPGKYQRPFLAALSAIIRAQKAPAVDTDRIYAAGLSMGGRSIYGLSFVAPHLFAACVPVSSGVFSPEDVREERPGNWWHLYNEGDYARHPDSIPRLEAFAARVRELGGDFRIGTYPAEGHNAWDAAWREDALWDWLFSKSLANERPAAVGGVRPAKERKSDRALAGKVVCTASKAGADAKRGPERAADGLDATAYVSAVPMEAGDWWMCEFKEPVTGRIRVQTGLVDGTRRLSRGHVEVSKDGKLWSRAASVSQKTGEASFQQRDPIRFVKLLAEPRSPEILTLREMRLE